ncbi:MAG: tRNA lysidine(34) synthetase TilS [Actinomycetota bacterium]
MARPDGRVTVNLTDAVLDAVGGNNCVVALGGGADSSMLLWSAVEAIGAERVRCVFVYHGLEGSDALRQAAINVADRAGVDLEVVEAIVHDGGNLEARARAARYEAIEALLADDEVALTGHTADDQAETVLMRLLRGSGSGALGGIPRRRGVWRRPFLDFSRLDLRETAEELDLPFEDDPANEDDRFLRARIRHGVMPAIELASETDVRAMILRSAELLASDDRLLEAQAGRIPVVSTPDAVSIPSGALRTAPVAVASRVVRRALRQLLSEHPGTFADVEAVLAAAEGGPATSITDGLHVTSEAPYVTIHRTPVPDAPGGFAIAVGQQFTWAGARYAITRHTESPPLLPGGRFTVMSEDAMSGAMSVRGAQPGDRIAIESGSTPIKEVLRASGVPPRLRPHSLVVTVDAKIAAVGGLRVASWARAARGKAVVIIEREVDT